MEHAGLPTTSSRHGKACTEGTIRTRRAARAAALLAAGALLLAPAAGGAAQPAGSEASLFDRGDQHLAFVGGYASGLHARDASNGDLGETVFVAFTPQWGVGLSDPVAEEHWYGGQLGLLVEGHFLYQTQPHGGSAAGLGLMLRYSFLRSRRLVPYIELGVGAMNLDFDREDARQSDGLNFLLQGGLGAHWFVSERVALTASWRFHHISNARIREPNDGIDSSLGLVGFTWFLD